MGETKKDIGNTINTDTKKMKTGEDAIKLTIGSNGDEMMTPDQITINLDKRETELIKSRSHQK